MIKKIGLVMLLSLIISTAELYYINSSPLLGEADIDDLKADNEKLKRLNLSDTDYMYYAYKGLYEFRPHVNDVSMTTGPYELIVSGYGILDVMTDGVVLWQVGLFDPECESYWNISDPCLLSIPKKFEKDLDDRVLSDELGDILETNNISREAYIDKFDEGWQLIDEKKSYFIKRGDKELNIYPINHFRVMSKRIPRAVKSEFYPRAGLYSTASISDDPYLKDWGYGRKFLLMPYGWFILADTTGGNSFILFDERFPCNMNASHQEFMEGYAEFYRVMFARLSFVESVMDKKPPWQGIYYLTYYPHFNKIWIVVKSIPKKEIEDSRILIDDVEAEREVIYPFIFVDIGLDEGNHRLDLITPLETYSTDFEVDLSPLLIHPASIMLRTDGNFSFGVVNIGSENQTIFLKNAVINLNKSRIKKDIYEEINLYHGTTVEVSLPKGFVEGEYYEMDISINYIIDNQVREYKIKIRSMAER